MSTLWCVPLFADEPDRYSSSQRRSGSQSDMFGSFSLPWNST